MNNVWSKTQMLAERTITTPAKKSAHLPRVVILQDLRLQPLADAFDIAELVEELPHIRRKLHRADVDARFSHPLDLSRGPRHEKVDVVAERLGVADHVAREQLERALALLLGFLETHRVGLRGAAQAAGVLVEGGERVPDVENLLVVLAIVLYRFIEDARMERALVPGRARFLQD